MSSNKINNFGVGDIVRVKRPDGKVFECFVTGLVGEGSLFYGKILPTSKYKVRDTTWRRYGLEEDGVIKMTNECEIKLISKGRKVVLEDLPSTVIYENRLPGSGDKVTFCLTDDYGGWSFNEDNSEAIVESYTRARSNLIKEEVRRI